VRELTVKELNVPISDEVIDSLNAGDAVTITGKIYTARDAAHRQIVELIEAGETPPFDFIGQVVFYAGPAPAKPGRPIGSIGPTTAGRMDLYAPMLISKGLKLMIGKGNRSRNVQDAIVNFRGIYFAATGGIAALMAKSVKSSRLIAFDELGTEAVMEIEVEKFPAIVAIDSKGRNLYENTKHNPQPRPLCAKVDPQN
jgi:fumarate hydratase subunit beta